MGFAFYKYHIMTKETKNSKHWAHKNGQNSWTMFKVISEFVAGFEKLNKIDPCVSVFGSARTKPGEKYYELAVEVASKICEAGYGVITGGGPGVMEAGNKGAHLAKGISVGLNIDLPFEQSSNRYIDPDKDIDHNYFFIRKVMFVKYAQAFVALPGGFGTFDELFEVLTLIQTKKISPLPVILVGTDFWSGLKDWIQKTVLETHGNISPDDMDLIPIVDDADEVIRIINDFYSGEGKGELEPNFDI